MHKGGQVSVQKCTGAVPAGNQYESVDNLIDNIETESGKDAADRAVFSGELPDGHAGGDPQDVQQNPQKWYYGEQHEEQAGGHAEYAENILGKVTPRKARDLL